MTSVGGHTMSARDLLTNLTAVLSVMTLAALLETVVPMFAAAPWKRDRRLANLGLTALSFFFHRMLHMLPALWRVHRIHHSDPFVDVTTTYRTHPVETAWRFLFAVVPVWLIGIPASAVLIQRLIQSTNSLLEHANIRLWTPVDGVLSLVWVTPNVHKIHH